MMWEIYKNREYWNKILGKELCEKLQNEIKTETLLEQNQEEYGAVENYFKQALAETEGWEEYSLELVFGEFYKIFGRTAITYAESRNLPGFLFLKESILENIYQRIYKIPLRVLIQDIHRCKEEGWLLGENEEAEYRDYCDRFLKDPRYVRQLCAKYPEMLKLILNQIVYQIQYMEEIMCAAYRDKQEMERLFWGGKQFSHVDKIDCGKSDSHIHGHTVAIVHFDNGEQLVFKPRCLKKEKYFEELYEDFCEYAGLSYDKVLSLDRGKYGWQAFVEEKPCKDEGAVKRYFKRMGVLLFLCYDMSAGDIHGENMIANGECPVLIDLEALPGRWNQEIPCNAEELVREELKKSVLSTGILPMPIWKNGGKGVILNALHKNEKVMAPFAMPVVCNLNRSDICIEYRRNEITLPNCLPRYEKHEIDPVNYTDEICSGFESAYRFMMLHKADLRERFRAFYSLESRYLMRHTQQYSMLLQTSYYPDFMENQEKRQLYFHVLDNRGTSEVNAKIFLPYERKALYEMDIPIFYIHGESKSLFDGDGLEYLDVFPKTTYELWQEKQESLGEEDLKRQLWYIKVSLELQEDNKRDRKPFKTLSGEMKKSERDNVVRKIADQICDKVVVFEGRDVNFISLRFQEDGAWSIGPVGMYLYDGIAGVVIFWALYRKQISERKYDQVWDLLTKKLFQYTENLEKGGRPESNHIGAFIGEGSILHGYLLLYSITGDELFLEYAKRHSEIVIQMADAEQCMDLLSGCAGAIVVLLKLYKEVYDGRYLKYAQRLGEKILSNLDQQEVGCGWRMPQMEKPLAGMAHGNSGLLLAFAYLMEEVPGKQYEQCIKNLLQYEDSVYDDNMRNWKDLRHPGGKRTSNNAWCHGATGIILARLKLKKIAVFKNDEQIKKDIKRCLKVFEESNHSQDICLCHGVGGDYLTLDIMEQELDVGKMRNDALIRIWDNMSRFDEIEVQVRENTSLMTGMSGVGCAMSKINLYNALFW